MSENNSELTFENIQLDVREKIVKNQVFITHYSDNNISALRIANKKINFYLSQELYTLIQKLIRFGFIDKLQSQPKIIPIQYSQKIGDLKVTAYRNDDSLFGSLSLSIESISSSIFYCHSFTTKGAHNKRINKWKKIIRQEQPSIFYLDQKMHAVNSGSIISETGIQKQFGKFLSRMSSDIPAKVVLSPLNPERLAKYNETAREHDTEIIWHEKYVKLLKFFFPDEEFSSSLPKNEQVANFVHQVEPDSELISSSNYYIDPMLRSTISEKESTTFEPLITPLDDNEILQLKSDLKIDQIIFW